MTPEDQLWVAEFVEAAIAKYDDMLREVFQVAVVDALKNAVKQNGSVA